MKENKAGNRKKVCSLRGYDLISGGRYIKVKAKKEEIFITENEWLTAKRLRNKYFIYLVDERGKIEILKV